MSSFLESVVNNHETIRSLSQAAGASMAAIFAPVGLWFTWKRTQALSKQNELTAKSQEYLSNNDEKKRLYDSYQLGIQEIAHEHEFRRLGGIVILGDSAKSKQFYKPAYTAISGIIRKFSDDLKSETEGLSSDEIKLKISRKLDLIAAIEQIKNRKIDASLVSPYEFSINLQNSYIPYCDLVDADLSYALLDKISMVGSKCLLTKLRHASIKDADLSSSNFRKADFSLANLGGSNLSNCNLTKASLMASDISGVDLRNSRISKLTILSRSDLNRDRLKELNYHLPSPIDFGEFYHPIKTARWDIENPPLVDDEIKCLVDEKTEFMRKGLALDLND